MGTTSRQERIGARIALLVSLVVGGAFIGAGFVSGDTGTVVIGVLVPTVTAVLGGPVMRWLRRGDGPYDARSEDEVAHERYTRLRHSGGNGNGR